MGKVEPLLPRPALPALSPEPLEPSSAPTSSQTLPLAVPFPTALPGGHSASAFLSSPPHALSNLGVASDLEA